LETIIAASIFVLVSVALSGVWVMYGRSLAKSSEVIAANSLARSVSEGLVANGWDWLKTLEGASPLPEEDFVVERVIRGRDSNIKFNVTYEAFFNTGKSMSTLFSDDICRLTITVRWRSSTGGKSPTPEYNNETTYSSYIYKKGI